MLNELIRLRDIGPTRQNAGICYHINLGGRSWSDKAKINRAFQSWPHYSGNLIYPVPHNLYPDDPGHGYDYTENLWNRRTKYGRLRWDLLDHLIKELSDA